MGNEASSACGGGQRGAGVGGNDNLTTLTDLSLYDSPRIQHTSEEEDDEEITITPADEADLPVELTTSVLEQRFDELDAEHDDCGMIDRATMMQWLEEETKALYAADRVDKAFAHRTGSCLESGWVEVEDFVAINRQLRLPKLRCDARRREERKAKGRVRRRQGKGMGEGTEGKEGKKKVRGKRGKKGKIGKGNRPTMRELTKRVSKPKGMPLDVMGDKDKAGYNSSSFRSLAPS